MTKESLGLREKDFRRFDERVDKSGGCWIWKGHKTRLGYGGFSLRGKWISAHRLSFLLHGGIFTQENQCVLHSCNDRACVNPAHLRAGSHLDNMRDLMKSGNHKAPSGAQHGTRLHPDRVARGERIANAKLTADSVREIRRLTSQGVILKDVARMFGVSVYPIYCIRKGIAWKHVA